MNALLETSITVGIFSLLVAASSPARAQASNLDDRYTDSDDCQRNVACLEGTPWFSEIGSVVRFVPDDGSAIGCTGTLINTTTEDLAATPYVLAAAHCTGTPMGGSLTLWFQFYWQTPTCNNPLDPPDFEFIQVTPRLAVKGIGTSTSEDFMLWELPVNSLDLIDVHFAGWSIEDIQPQRGTLIGHPMGDVKKIVVDSNAVAWNTDTWGVTPEIGRLEVGQSGSPLLNEHRQIVGVLRSPASCAPTGISSGNSKLEHFWDIEYLNTFDGLFYSLSDFIDPDNTAATSLPSIANYDLAVSDETFSDSTADFAAGFFRTAKSITATNLTLTSTGRLHLRARESITITGDFLAEAGGEFLARIEPAPGGGGANARMGEEVVEPPLAALPRLEPNYPNPVREWTTFRFTIPEESRVTLKIYDVLGREVMTLFDADHEPGNVTLRWNPSDPLGRSLSSGVYLYRLQVGNHVETRSLTVLR